MTTLGLTLVSIAALVYVVKIGANHGDDDDNDDSDADDSATNQNKEGDVRIVAADQYDRLRDVSVIRTTSAADGNGEEENTETEKQKRLL